MAVQGLKTKGETRLATLLEVAAALFLERGYEALALDEIIARAGGSRRNIYSTFGGKEGLFKAAVTALCAELTHPIQGAPTRAAAGIGERLHELGAMFVDIALDPRTVALHRLMISEGKRFPELAQAIYQSGRGRGAEVVAPLLEAQRSAFRREYAQADAHELAQMFVGLVINEVQIYALIGLSDVDEPAHRAHVRARGAVSLFINGLFDKVDGST